MACHKSNRKQKKPTKKHNVYTTPQKSKVQGAVEFCRAKNIPVDPREVFNFFEVIKSSGYEMIQDGAPSRRLQHQEGIKDTRGRKPKMTPQQTVGCIEILKDSTLGLEAKGMSWHAIIWDQGLEVTVPTVRRTLSLAWDFGKYKACLKEFMDQKTQDDRWAWADAELLRRPEPKDFRKIRYSDEFHVGYGPEGQLWIIRRRGTGMRYRPDNIQYRDPPPEKGRYKAHGWAAVGYDFKMPKILWYDVPSNNNGAITMDVYINEILEVEVKKWIERGDDFILEQDGAPGHGGTGNNESRKRSKVARWLQKNKVPYFFNCHNAPDLAPIENCWSGPKQYISKRPHWDLDSLKELAQEGWDHVSQDFINKQIDSMPQRLRDCCDLKGRMTGW